MAKSKPQSLDEIMAQQQSQPAPAGGSDKKRVAKLAMKGRGNRFYAFRNMSRLESLKRFKTLFALMKVLSILVLVAALASLAVYIMVLIFTVIITLGFAKADLTNFAQFGLYGLIVSGGIFALSIVLRILIERVYYVAERSELKKIPDGAQKYLDIMRVNIITDFINLGLWAAVIGAIAAGVAIDIQNKAVIGVIIGIVILIFIVGKIIYGRLYNRVAQQIEDVKAERRQNQMTNTQY